MNDGSCVTLQGSAELYSFLLGETVRDHGLGWPTGLCVRTWREVPQVKAVLWPVLHSLYF